MQDAKTKGIEFGKGGESTTVWPTQHAGWGGYSFTNTAQQGANGTIIFRYWFEDESEKLAATGASGEAWVIPAAGAAFAAVGMFARRQCPRR